MQISAPELIAQINSINKDLEAQKIAFENLHGELRKIVEADTLQGKAYISAKVLLEQKYQPLIKGFILA